MMAFWTKYEENGARRYLPTPDLEHLLKQERISAVDIRQFRSSNKVSRLLDKVLQKRGFVRDYDTSEWVRKAQNNGSVTSQIHEWAKAHLGISSQKTVATLIAGEDLKSGDFVMNSGGSVVKAISQKPIGVAIEHALKFGKINVELIPAGAQFVNNENGEVVNAVFVTEMPHIVFGDEVDPSAHKVQEILHNLPKLKSISDKQILAIDSLDDSKYLVAKLQQAGWFYAQNHMAWYPPKPISDVIDEKVYGYKNQFGQSPNSLHIGSDDWLRLCSQVPGIDFEASVGAHPKQYHGMQVTIMPPGSKLFVSTIATGSVEPLKDEIFEVANPFKEIGGPWAIKIKAAEPVVEKPKRITPPSQMKRKLAL
jgi:hypothetical protein